MKRKTIIQLAIAIFTLNGLVTSLNGQWLSVTNNKIVKDGNPITLRGINFGNWLVLEGYMMNLDVNGKRSPSAIRAAMKNLLGGDESKTVTWENNWRNSYITEADFQRAKALGYNVIRVPFHYNMFWTGSTTKNDGFTWLDKAATWAQNNGIYVIFCMHCAPGCQNPDYHSDNTSSDDHSGAVNFWSNWNNVTTAGKIWKLIATRYIGNPWVAGYDLLNEPKLDNNKSNLKQSYKDMTTQIRTIDGNHLIFAEGNYWGSDFWDMQERWDSKLVFEGHYYGGQGEGDPNPDLSTRKSLANNIGVAYVNGEFGENTADWVKAARIDYETQNVGWLFWAWKRQTTDRAIYSFNSTSGWDQITNYIKYGGSKPSVANVEIWLSAIYNNVKIGSCSYVSSIQDKLRPGWPTGSVIWLQNGSKYVSSNNGTSAMTCDRTSIGGWEKFTIVDAGDWKIALLGNNGKYINSQNGTSAMTCTSSAIAGWEAFEWVDVNGQVALKGFNGKFVCSEGGSTSGMNCNREIVSGWESFTYATTSKSALVSTSINENSVSENIIYPNPLTDGNLNIKLKTIHPNVPAVLNIFDMSGRLILTRPISNNLEVISTSDILRSGIYNVQVINGNDSFSSKLSVK